MGVKQLAVLGLVFSLLIQPKLSFAEEEDLFSPDARMALPSGPLSQEELDRYMDHVIVSKRRKVRKRGKVCGRKGRRRSCDYDKFYNKKKTVVDVKQQSKYKLAIEVLEFFKDFVLEFDKDKQRTYTSVKDFRIKFQHRMFKKYPNLYWQADASKLTSRGPDFRTRLYGFSAGVRYEHWRTEKALGAIIAQPIYGEKRKISFTESGLGISSEINYRANVGVAGEYEWKDFIAAGGEVLFQPHIFDFGDYRIYAETYIRIKVFERETQLNGKYKVEEVYFIPKVIYWRNGDDFTPSGSQDFAGIDRISDNLFAFFNLEFHFEL